MVDSNEAQEIGYLMAEYFDGQFNEDKDRMESLSIEKVTTTNRLSAYADNPDADGTEADPYENALNNLLSQVSGPFVVEEGSGWFYEPNAPFTISRPFAIKLGGRGGRPMDKAATTVIETTSGNGLLVVDNTTSTAENGHIGGFWIYQGADDFSGTGIELREAGRWTLDNLGVARFNKGVYLNGALSCGLGHGVRTIDNNINVDLSRSSSYNNINVNVNTIHGHHKTAKGVASIRQQNGLGNSYLGVTVQGCSESGVLIEGGQATTLGGYYELNNAEAVSGSSDIRVTSHGYGLTINNVRTTGADVTQSIYIDDVQRWSISDSIQAETGIVGLETTANAGASQLRNNRFNGGKSVSDWGAIRETIGPNEDTMVGYQGAMNGRGADVKHVAVDVTTISPPTNGMVAFHDGSGSAGTGLAYYWNGWSVLDGGTSP